MEYKAKFEEATAKVEELTALVESTEATITDKDERIADLETKVADLRKENEDFWAAAKDSAVKNAIASGKYDETDEEFLADQCDLLGVEAFTAMVDKVKVPEAPVRAVEMINRTEGGHADPTDRSRWSWEDYERNDPTALNELRHSDPDLYYKLLNEDEKKYN